MNAPIPKGVTAPAVNPDRLPAEVRASIEDWRPAIRSHTCPRSMRHARRWLVWKPIANLDPAKKGRARCRFTRNGSPRNGTLDTP
ncbi:MAG: hypothetical protein MZV65_42020 [Chromatiales bacterium]|nr:hypothetical protein [Chromatiales bacterium]